MDLIQIFIESLGLLSKKPRVFIPRFLTTGLYSVYLLALAYLTLEVNRIVLSVELSPEAVRGMLPLLLLYLFLILISALFLYFIDLLSYAMYPSIVRDYQDGREINLRKALGEALGKWKVLLVLEILIILASGISSLIFFLFYVLDQSIGGFMILGLLVVFLLIMGFAVLIFFVVPTAIIENKGVLDSFRNGVKLGLEYRNDLIRLNLFFLILAIITLSLGMLSNLQGIVGVSAIVSFLIIRFFQALVYTYISIVNPYLFLRIKSQ